MICYTVEEIRKIYEKINYSKLSCEDKILKDIEKMALKKRKANNHIGIACIVTTCIIVLIIMLKVKVK